MLLDRVSRTPSYIEAVLIALYAIYSHIFIREDYRIRLDVPTLATPEPLDLDAIYAQLCRDPVNDSLDMDTYQVIPGSYGYTFDLDKAKQALSHANEPFRSPWWQRRRKSWGSCVFQDELGHCETKAHRRRKPQHQPCVLCVRLWMV